MKLLEMSMACKLMYHMKEVLMLEENRPKPIFIDNLCIMKAKEDKNG